ncbi:hypothetical protein GW17_00020119 [Ensete ventricosum]|nr:hypothetical protein GW17_00020119 [Ensete ventricosum]RZR79265.1 hypothetical protein BHM03_00004949 [Ensete ventricosum]
MVECETEVSPTPELAFTGAKDASLGHAEKIPSTPRPSFGLLGIPDGTKPPERGSTRRRDFMAAHRAPREARCLLVEQAASLRAAD